MLLGFENAEAYVTRDMRIGANCDGNAGFEEALEQARGGVVVGQPFAKRRGRQLDAAIRVVRARGHFVPKAFDVRGRRPSILRKAHRQVGVGHRIEGEGAFARGTPRIDVRTPHAACAEFFPNVHVFRIIDPARGEAGLIGGINALAAAFARCD